MVKLEEIPSAIKPWLEQLYVALDAETEAQKAAAACALLGCIAGEVSLRMGPRMASDLLHSLEVHTARAIVKAEVKFNA